MTYIPMKRKNHYVAMQYDIQTPTWRLSQIPLYHHYVVSPRSEWIGPGVNSKLDSFLRIKNSAKRWLYFFSKKAKLRRCGVLILATWTGYQEQAHGKKLPGFLSAFQLLVQTFLSPNCTLGLWFHLSFYILLRKSFLFKLNQVGI